MFASLIAKLADVYLQGLDGKSAQLQTVLRQLVVKANGCQGKL
jgi:hypothetical protein